MDEELIRRAQEGDRRAFDGLVQVEYPRLFRLAHGILRDRSHAEDATQQACIDIWRNIRRLREPSRFEAWSYRILVHACYAEARRTPRWLPATAVPPSAGPSATDAYATVLHRDELEQGFRQLSVDHRAVIILHFLMDMTLGQVAETLDLRPGTVNSRISRALEAMRKAMGVGPARESSVPARRGDLA